MRNVVRRLTDRLLFLLLLLLRLLALIVVDGAVDDEIQFRIRQVSSVFVEFRSSFSSNSQFYPFLIEFCSNFSLHYEFHQF